MSKIKYLGTRVMIHIAMRTRQRLFKSGIRSRTVGLEFFILRPLSKIWHTKSADIWYVYSNKWEWLSVFVYLFTQIYLLIFISKWIESVWNGRIEKNICCWEGGRTLGPEEGTSCHLELKICNINLDWGWR